MSAILAFLKTVYEHKEKVILGILVLALAAVAFVQTRSKKNSDSDEGNGKNPKQFINDEWKPAPPRPPGSYRVPAVNSPVPLSNYLDMVKGGI
ncbi:MAG: hypothetical protein HY801_04640, partial [Candidatus Lindowbacteria bacterium]|nr:hypothetical protein [Candidatus Lindowbacteria bacterium]